MRLQIAVCRVLQATGSALYKRGMQEFRQQTHILRQVFYEFSLAAVQKNGDLHAFVFERFQQSDKAALCPANL